MSYLVASMLSAFAVGIIVGVMLEATSRNYFLRHKEKDED